MRSDSAPVNLRDRDQNKLVLGASWTMQSKPTELQDALQVYEAHLNLLALTPRPLEAVGTSERSGNLSGVLMDIARDLVRRLFWTALRHGAVQDFEAA
jgi:hypothetical protein